MTTTFVDTSAILAYIAPRDRCHGEARAIMAQLHASRARLVSSSYVIHEAASLLQARLGVAAVRTLHYEVAPGLDLVWIDRPLHARAMAALLAANSRRISLTDWSSFEVMRDGNIDDAFAFDPHFEEQGFRLVRPQAQA